MKKIYASDNNLVEVWATGTPSEKDIQEIHEKRYNFPIHGEDRRDDNFRKENGDPAELFPESIMTIDDVSTVTNIIDGDYGEIRYDRYPLVGFAIVIDNKLPINYDNYDNTSDISSVVRDAIRDKIPLIRAIGMSTNDFNDFMNTIDELYCSTLHSGAIRLNGYGFEYDNSFGDYCMADEITIPALTKICEKYKFKYNVKCEYRRYKTLDIDRIIFYFAKSITEFKVKENNKTVEQTFDGLTEEQKNVVYALISEKRSD